MDDLFHQAAATHGIGTLDAVSAQCISGWAWDPALPDESILVDILDGSDLLATVRASLPRPDLQALGMGNGRHGFAIEFGPAVLPLALHLIRVRRQTDGAELHLSPWALRREAAGFDPAARQYLTRQIEAECAWARQPADLGPALATLSSQLGALLQRHLELAEQQAPASRAHLTAVLDAATPARWIEAAGAAMSARYPALLMPRFERPRVTVVIPVFNHFQLTYNCLASVREHLPTASFEVILVDDASSDETVLASLVLEGSVRVLRNEHNIGFVRSCNRGAAQARGDFVFFLNNDTLVQPGWLDELLATFDADPQVGVAGSKLLERDGTLQEAGGIVWRLGDAWNWGRGADADAPQFNYLRNVDYVSGAALMIRAGLFAELGGFDDHFAPAYYEDTDLCFRARAAGWRVVLQPLSAIIHLEGQTNGTDPAVRGIKRYQTIHRRKFLARWQATLAAHRHNGEAPELECERAVQRRAVFIDETVPTPDQDAGSLAATRHIRALMRLGYKVTFLPSDNLARLSPYVEQLQRIGVECIYQPYCASVEEYFRQCRVPIDLVYLHRFGSASKYIGIVRRHQPAARVLYNVADLHFLRLQREAELTADDALARRARQVRAQELAAVHAADVTIVHSPVEKQLLGDEAAGAHVCVVPWSYSPAPAADGGSATEGVVFVGGFRHAPNVDAAKWLVREVMPLVWHDLPALRCTLVGSHMPDEIRALGSHRVEVPGHVPDLMPIYRRRRVAVAPLRFGAGIKGKVLEAFAAGLPCVMTPTAAEGIPLTPALGSCLVHESAKSLAAAIVALHQDLAAWQAAVEAGQALIAQHYSDAAMDAALTTALI